ncbi:MAG: putative virulence factor [Lachnoclostridium sp.]|nr:putative virulence factor [Lachnoclostridium sp.]
MENKIIDAQMSANGAGLGWGRSFLKGSDLRELRSDLIRNRIDLRRIRYAASVNPAAAIFGKSQVGKSYMVDCLLTSETNPLTVYDAQGNAHGFIEKINPTGNGKEATSLISRFTTQKVWKDERFPVKAMMLSPVDVVLVLCDTYYNDVMGHKVPNDEAINAEIQRLRETYGNRPAVQTIIGEDDMMELREYFTLGLMEQRPDFQEALLRLNYFETLSELIDAVPVAAWADVFSFLWNRNPIITEVFNKLINTLERLDFSPTVYIKIAAVDKYLGTILHVDRIYELFGITELDDEKNGKTMIEKAKEPLMVALTENGKEVENIEKSVFCALAMEVDFTIVNPDDASSSEKLLKEKPFLHDLDILDFPGARSRQKNPEADITKKDASLMLIRGKVAYLFNKYSQQYLITNLLFCHDDTQNEVNTLPTLLKSWVEKTVGKTPSEREVFLRTAEVSPLFVIGTKFNIELKRRDVDSKGSAEQREQEKRNRWIKRFSILSSVISASIKSPWELEWTPGKAFKNFYMLRSFEYSCLDGLYEGYQEKDDNGDWVLSRNADGTLRGEQRVSDDYKDFFAGLKSTFLQNEYVTEHFEDASKSWDEAVAPGKDGSAWIIENLTRSGRNMKAAREQTFSRLSDSAMTKLCSALKKHFHDDNSDSELRRALESAGRIELLFDALFGKDKYFFSDFINALLVHEDEINDTILCTVNSIKVLDDTDMSVLFAIRNRAKIVAPYTEDEHGNRTPVDLEENMKENRRRMRETYHFSTDEELDEFLAGMKLTMEDIINPPMVRNLARIIVDAVEKYWMDTYLSLENFSEFVERGMSEKGIETLLSNMRVLYKDKLHMSERLTARLAPYVTARENLDDMAEMLADICAEMLNKFINTIGTSYFEEELWKDVHATVDHNGFDIKVDAAEYDSDIDFDGEKTREGLNDVFDVFDNVDVILNQVPVDTEKLSYFSNYHAFREWTDMMKIAFLATCGIPKYDVVMNNELRNVLVKYIVDNDNLKPMLKPEYGLSELATL